LYFAGQPGSPAFPAGLGVSIPGKDSGQETASCKMMLIGTAGF